MRILLDESVPRQLGPLLTGHRVTTVPRVGWAGVRNGELLRRAADRFDVLVTGDRSLEYQQNLALLDLAVIVLVAPDNRVETITALAPVVLAALPSVGPGQMVRIGAGSGESSVQDAADPDGGAYALLESHRSWG